jgi:hypothetical protein
MPKGARQYRHVRDDLARAAHELKGAERALVQDGPTLRMIAVRDNRRQLIARYTDELCTMFHTDAAHFIAQEIAAHA